MAFFVNDVRTKMNRAGFLRQIFPEMRERPLPRELRRRFVVARGRVVVEAVLCAGVGVDLMVDAGGFQRGFEGWVGGVDPLVVLGQMADEWRLDVADAGGVRRDTVVGRAGLHVDAEFCREVIDDAAAVAEAGDAEFAGRLRMRLDEARAVFQVGAQLCLIESRLQGAAIVVVARVTADREQAVRRQRQKALGGDAPRDVFDVGIQPPIFMHDQHGREWPRLGRLHEIAAHGARVAAGRGVGDVGSLDALVGEGDRLRTTWQQGLGHATSTDNRVCCCLGCSRAFTTITRPRLGTLISHRMRNSPQFLR